VPERRPELVPHYAELYGRRAYPPREYANDLRQQVQRLCEEVGISTGGHESDGTAGNRARAVRADTEASDHLSAEGPSQLSLL
jgi:hypothetical protein